MKQGVLAQKRVSLLMTKGNRATARVELANANARVFVDALSAQISPSLTWW